MKKYLLFLVFMTLFPSIYSNNVSSCSNIVSSGYYELIDNVTSSGTCFTIGISNVELNCNGFTITHSSSSSGSGVDLDSGTKSNITIRNCYIEDLATSTYGITMSTTSNSFLLNNNIKHTYGTQDAIVLWESSNNVIDKNYVIKNIGGYDPFYAFSNSNYNNITDNIFIFNYTSGTGATGLHIQNSEYNRIEGNYVYTYGWASNLALRLHSNSLNNLLINNYGYSQLGTGLHLSSSGTDNNTIYGNFINATTEIYSNSGSSNNLNNSIGGNYFANITGTGFSQTCVDGDSNGICDSSYNLGGSNIDFLPLSQIPSWYSISGPSDVGVQVSPSINSVNSEVVSLPSVSFISIFSVLGIILLFLF